ncbi:hypothetical protein PMAYCL1PPCAC_29078, partial [Pristionchus mayeri]
MDDSGGRVRVQRFFTEYYVPGMYNPRDIEEESADEIDASVVVATHVACDSQRRADHCEDEKEELAKARAHPALQTLETIIIGHSKNYNAKSIDQYIQEITSSPKKYSHSRKDRKNYIY